MQVDLQTTSILVSGLGRMTGVEVCFLDPPKLDFDLEEHQESNIKIIV